MAGFSPASGTIALMGAGGIYLMNADGGNLRKVEALGDHGGLDWARGEVAEGRRQSLSTAKDKGRH
ncbi:MAG: hypothetical protein M3R61_12840 [Chloroflexota bacterium]|nr:hypothetical protein [Chloroflexota bacterium]